MATGLATWSETAANNATADTAVNWQEGQAPSSVNDSARAMMASAAKWRDDISGLVVSSGTSTAYTMTSRQNFATLAAMDGLEIAFTPHTNCGASPTLSVDGLSGQPIKGATGLNIPAGTLLAGTPYRMLYNNATNSFYLSAFFGNPYNIPISGGMPFFGSVAPNSNFAFCTGSAISRTTYATLFGLISTTYGAGDGSTTFNLPDLQGRVLAGADPGAFRLSGATMNFLTAGGTGGVETRTLATANLPPYTPSGSIANGAISISQNAAVNGGGSTSGGGAFGLNAPGAATITASQGTSTFTGTAQGGSSQSFGIVQPTMLCNWLIRII